MPAEQGQPSYSVEQDMPCPNMMHAPSHPKPCATHTILALRMVQRAFRAMGHPAVPPGLKSLQSINNKDVNNVAIVKGTLNFIFKKW